MLLFIQPLINTDIIILLKISLTLSVAAYVTLNERLLLLTTITLKVILE